MMRSIFNLFKSGNRGKSRSHCSSAKTRKLRVESLEERSLLHVGLPIPCGALEPDGSATAFYANETVSKSRADDLVIEVSSAILGNNDDENFVDEFDATSADELIELADEPGSTEQIRQGDETIIEDDDEEVATVLTLIQYFNSMGIKDYSRGYPRDVFFYSSIDPECDASKLDFSNESTLFVDLGSRENQELNLARILNTVITRSGGGDEPQDPDDTPESAGEISSTGSPFISERNDGSSNAPSNATYFTIHIPETPFGYFACLEFAPGSNSGAIWGTDYGLVQAGSSNGAYYPLAPVTQFQNPPYNYQEVSGGFDYCIVPFNDGLAEDPESFSVRFFIERNSGGASSRIYGNTLTCTILDDDRAVNVYWDDGNYNGQGASLSENPRGGGARVYPEQETVNVNSLKNVASLNFTLDEPAPIGGQVVYFKLMDPDNYISLGSGQSNLSESALFTPNDNHQIFLRNAENLVQYVRDDINTITIPAGETDYSVQVEIPVAYAGDNWIVFAGTSESAVSASVLGTSEFDRYSIVRTSTNQNVSQSQMLTVWRTLWLELNQMAAPVPPTPSNPVSDGFAWSDHNNLNSIENWGETEYFSLAPPTYQYPSPEPINFDLLFQPDLPETSLLKEEFEKACVSVKVLTQEQIISMTNTTEVNDAPFQRYLDNANPTNIGRYISSASNTNQYWLIYALGAYDAMRNGFYQDWDNKVYTVNGENKVYCEIGYANDEVAIIYNETLRDLIKTAYPPKESTEWTIYPWVTISEAKRRLAYHEILHYFVGVHSSNDVGIMYNSSPSSDFYLFTTSDISLRESQIYTIQGRLKNSQGGSPYLPD